jgi:hypothetical protein
MTNAETVKLIGLLVVAYPNYDKFRDEKHVHGTVALWGQMFAEDDFGLVQMALEKHIATSKWPPSIADIRDILAQITMPGLLAPDEAWAAVSKLLTMHESLTGPADSYLPAPIAQAVDTVGFSQLKALRRAAAWKSDKAGLDRVAFLDAYKAIYDRERERAALPRKLRDKIEAARKLHSDGSDRMMGRLEEQYREREACFHQGGRAMPEAKRQGYLTGGNDHEAMV